MKKQMSVGSWEKLKHNRHCLKAGDTGIGEARGKVHILGGAVIGSEVSLQGPGVEGLVSRVGD